jgi:sulfite reductase (NADPH) hemoprotein beta-component
MSRESVSAALLALLDPSSIVLDALSGGLTVGEAFGTHLSYISSRQRVADKVEALLASKKAGRQLAASLSSWLLTRGDGAACTESLAFVDQWLAREAPFEAEVKALQASAHLLPKRDLWVLGGDGWGRGSDTAALHAYLSSGEDINIVLLASDPSAPEETKATLPRRDVALYALNYGGAYVASTSAASPEHLARAVGEARAFPGPSVVVVLVPATAQAGAAACDSGAWPLYRWDPRKEGSAEGAFSLDSAKLREEMADFVARETHLALLTNAQPAEGAAEGGGGAEGSAPGASDADASPSSLLLSYQRLMGALEHPPLRIIFASDGGNAEGLAKRIATEARKRGYTSISLSTMDALAAAAGGTPKGLLAHLEVPKPTASAAAPASAAAAAAGPVLFVVSTAGQGEFPSNGRAFWKCVEGAGAASGGAEAAAAAAAPAACEGSGGGPLSGLPFAVFGLGDSNYWPRKEHAHFFNKASIDLFCALKALGAAPMVPRGSGDDQSTGGYLGDFRRWAPALWMALGVGVAGEDGSQGAAPATRAPEAIKPTSNYLRGTIAQGLQDSTTGALAYEDTILTKFHGIYQQDNRDERGARRRAGLEPAYSFMVRVRIPGGVCSPAQYIALDDIADTFANGTLRATTRQAIQFHGIIKGVLKPSIAAINRALMDTLAACGDVNRNVMLTTDPNDSALHASVLAFTRELSDVLSPRTGAYHEIWLADKLVGGGCVDTEPLYGPTYLPRKFKIAVAIPPHNDVDVYAHCLSFVAHAAPGTGALEGFTLTVGGGMGMTHNTPSTFPRLAQDFCFASPQDAITISQAIITIQRDFGDRTNRRHARFKYTVDDRGLPWLWEEVEKRTGLTLAPPRPYTFTSNGDKLGWTPGPGGTHNYTLFIQNGRIVDKGAHRLKTGLRAFATLAATSAAALGMHVRFTPNQNLMLAAIPGAQRPRVEALLAEYGLENSARASGLRLNSMACVALPTCGLSLAEAERYLPTLLDRLEGELDAAGLREDAITIRMTGCPNGCARPYISEIGLVGRSPGIYNLYLGAGFSGERLSKLFREDVGEEAIVAALGPLFKRYALERTGAGEHFGDWCVRAGVVKATLSGRTFHEQ